MPLPDQCMYFENSCGHRQSFAGFTSFMTQVPKYCAHATRGGKRSGLPTDECCVSFYLSNEDTCRLTLMWVPLGKNAEIFNSLCNNTVTQNILYSQFFLLERQPMLLELALILCFDHCEVLNPFMPQSKKMFCFCSRKTVDNVYSFNDRFLLHLSVLIQFKM